MEIGMDYYLDGYTMEEINCIDMMIAGASGQFNVDNYYYYAFCWGEFVNWNIQYKSDWLVSRNQILDKIGIALRYIKIEDGYSLLEAIQSKINEGISAILIAKYSEVFYLDSYMDDANINPHAIVITDYSKQKKTFLIRDGAVIRGLPRGNIMTRLHITEDMLIEIWTRSNGKFHENQDFFADKLFYLEKTADGQIQSYQDLIDDYFKSLGPSRFIFFITIFNDSIETFTNDEVIQGVRRTFYGAVKILFREAERFLMKLEPNDELYSKFITVRDKYLKHRFLIISKLHACALKNKKLNKEEIENSIDQVRKQDLIMYDLMMEISTYGKRQNEKYCI